MESKIKSVTFLMSRVIAHGEQDKKCYFSYFSKRA